MFRLKNIVILAMLFCFGISAVNIAEAAPFKADAKTKRIPAGTTFKLEFLQGVDIRFTSESIIICTILRPGKFNECNAKSSGT